jgi:hypothetical protein
MEKNIVLKYSQYGNTYSPHGLGLSNPKVCSHVGHEKHVETCEHVLQWIFVQHKCRVNAMLMPHMHHVNDMSSPH